MGNWLGSWLGKWFGAGEPAPAGSLSGTATVALTASATLMAKGNLSGSAAFAITGIGALNEPPGTTQQTAGGGAWRASMSVDTYRNQRRKRDEEALLLMAIL